jgi:hypothetical protein
VAVAFFGTGGSAYNVGAEFYCQSRGPDAGNYLELMVKSDGSFEVFNSRTQKTKQYTRQDWFTLN